MFWSTCSILSVTLDHIICVTLDLAGGNLGGGGDGRRMPGVEEAHHGGRHRVSSSTILAHGSLYVISTKP